MFCIRDYKRERGTDSTTYMASIINRISGEMRTSRVTTS